MKISIIMPVYNSEKYIEKSIQSVIDQSYEKWELIIINDGSTDNSMEICRKYAAFDVRIKLLSTENGGVSKARNIGLKEVSGEYILFLDSDDTISKDCLKSSIEHIQKVNADICLFGFTIIYTENQKKVICPKETKNITQFAFWEEESGHCFEQSLLHCVGNKLYSFALVKEITFKEEWNYHEDIMFCLEAFNEAQNIVILAESHYFYNCIENSLAHQVRLGRYNAAEVVYRYVRDNVLNENEAKHLSTAINDFLLYNMLGEIKALTKSDLRIKVWKLHVEDIRNGMVSNYDLRGSNIGSIRIRGVVYLLRMKLYLLLYLACLCGMGK